MTTEAEACMNATFERSLEDAQTAANADSYDLESTLALIRDVEANEAIGPDLDTYRLMPGGDFVLDGSPDLQARWGNHSAVLWARGESLLMVAPYTGWFTMLESIP